MLKKKSSLRKSMGFTLIELLIVVAIIAILAAIAVPNFLEAQTRSKVSRVKSDLRTLKTAFEAYLVDHLYIPRDANDPGSPWAGTDWYTDNPGGKPDYDWADGRSSLRKYYRFAFLSPLTTPVAYINSIPHDAFTRQMPFGYDTRYKDPIIHYAVLSSAGPDRQAGDWLRSLNPNKMALPYDTTNGTKSRGDIFRAMAIKNADTFKTEYPFEFN